MTTLFLARHGAHPLLGKVLVGRTDVALSATGEAQAHWLGERLARERGEMLQTSPQQRARETAHFIAHKIGRTPDVVAALDEVNVGDWTGRSFADLKSDPAWRQWNAARTMARAPSGETLLEVQSRVMAHVERVRTRHPEGRVVLVSHSDVIRAAVLYCLGLSLDAFWRIEIHPGSLTTLCVDDRGAKLIALNETMPA
jgi:probable phosphoglycerate mutase